MNNTTKNITIDIFTGWGGLSVVFFQTEKFEGQAYAEWKTDDKQIARLNPMCE